MHQASTSLISVTGRRNLVVWRSRLASICWMGGGGSCSPFSRRGGGNVIHSPQGVMFSPNLGGRPTYNVSALLLVLFLNLPSCPDQSAGWIHSYRGWEVHHVTCEQAIQERRCFRTWPVWIQASQQFIVSQNHVAFSKPDKGGINLVENHAPPHPRRQTSDFWALTTPWQVTESAPAVELLAQK